MSDTVITEKHTLRDRLLTGRKTLSGLRREAADRSIWTALRDFLNDALPGAERLAAYRPFGAEPGATLEPEVPERLASEYEVLLPITLADNDLDWTLVGTELPPSQPAEQDRPGMALTGPKGTEALAPACGPEAIERAEAVIVPALAVSHSGMRLGRGGGSYDRALARVRPGVPVVALLRDGEFGLEVPTEAHDRPVTGVITPADGYMRITPAGRH